MTSLECLPGVEARRHAIPEDHFDGVRSGASRAAPQRFAAWQGHLRAA
jgi:hypothetical protein